jgi:hypothetical protein
VVDAVIPADWITTNIEYPSGQRAVRLAYPEWAKDTNYFWHLTDGDEQRLTIHASYRKKYGDN